LNTLSGPTAPLTSVALADAETKIVSGSFDKTVWVWEIGGKGAMLHTLTGHNGKLHNQFSCFSRLLSRFSSFTNMPTGAVNSVRCDGMMVMSASSDSTLKVWDLRTPSYLVKTLTGTPFLFHFLFSPKLTCGRARWRGEVLSPHK
jgi:WD40 repeat protein